MKELVKSLVLEVKGNFEEKRAYSIQMDAEEVQAGGSRKSA